ncbi:MAG TPA: response regulator transcription factor [Pyrinomonadaceae bacterium]|jgi:DNA-binding response OmpR family regulator
MRILIAEDDLETARLLKALLVKWGYEVTTTRDGAEAWETLQTEGAPPLVILDVMMPYLTGIELCRKFRETPACTSCYIILLTARTSKEDVVAGLAAGADDYITKPFDIQELRARVQVGVRIVELQESLAQRVRELEDALSQVKQLRGLLPICSYCKKIRDDQNYWQKVESYLGQHSDARISHSVCPDCYDDFVKPELEKLHSAKEPH